MLKCQKCKYIGSLSNLPLHSCQTHATISDSLDSTVSDLTTEYQLHSTPHGRQNPGEHKMEIEIQTSPIQNMSDTSISTH